MTDISLDMLDVFNSNPEAEEAGVWTYLDTEEQVGFKIRAFGSKAVLDLRDKLNKPYASMARLNQELPKEKSDEIGHKVVAGGVLADWKGIKVGGDVIPYSAENAYTVLSNPKLAKMLGFILSFSMDSQNYRDELREDGGKNS